MSKHYVQEPEFSQQVMAYVASSGKDFREEVWTSSLKIVRGRLGCFPEFDHDIIMDVFAHLMSVWDHFEPSKGNAFTWASTVVAAEYFQIKRQSYHKRVMTWDFTDGLPEGMTSKNVNKAAWFRQVEERRSRKG